MASTASGMKREESRTTGVGQAAADFKNKAEEASSTLVDKAKDAASTVADKAKDAASGLAKGAGDVASAVGQKAEDAASAVGGGMRSLAGTMRENLPSEGVLGSATRGVAGAIDSTGRYLQEEGLSGMMDDVTNLIRRNPLPALLVGVGIGFLLARTLSRS